MVGDLLDRVAAVEQHAGVAVDVGDLALAGRGGHEARVEGEDARGPWRGARCSGSPARRCRRGPRRMDFFPVSRLTSSYFFVAHLSPTCIQRCASAARVGQPDLARRRGSIKPGLIHDLERLPGRGLLVRIQVVQQPQLLRPDTSGSARLCARSRCASVGAAFSELDPRRARRARTRCPSGAGTS